MKLQSVGEKSVNRIVLRGDFVVLKFTDDRCLKSMKRISIYEFREDVPKVISDLYDNSSICLYMSADGFFLSDNSNSDVWFVGRNENDVIEYFSCLL